LAASRASKTKMDAQLAAEQTVLVSLMCALTSVFRDSDAFDSYRDHYAGSIGLGGNEYVSYL